MKHVCILIIALFNIGTAQIRYHTLDIKGNEPVITNRCVTIESIKESNTGFVKETIDCLGRCVRLDFYKNQQEYFTAVDLPSIVTYQWTDSSVIECLLNDNEELLNVDGNMVRPNKTEYILTGSKVEQVKEFYNEKFLKAKKLDFSCTLDEASFFMIYSGCEIKINKKYRLKF